MSSNTIDLARRLAELGQKEDAQKAYCLVLQQEAEKKPELEMEAASYIFFSEGDYQIAYTTFVSLYNHGFYQAELMDLMTQAFYLPNVAEQRKRYEQNCERLSRYPYLFRKDFLEFDELPILFFPFNDEGYIPFYKAENRFGEYVNFNDPVIDRYFFKDLENPILATDVYSQYQLEYLTDNVRKSEWVGRENHIYLHYTDWTVFCAHLQCLTIYSLLRDSKQVFLIGDEISQYPIDFKERFGIDYSKYPVKPVGIREVNRLIWHTQLASHNGGDFFNEIFYGHPNLLTFESIMFDELCERIKKIRVSLKKNKALNTYVGMQLAQIKTPTDKDLLVALFLDTQPIVNQLDKQARIAPALFFQPHFHNMIFQLRTGEKSRKTSLESEQYDQLRNSPIFKNFKYIKTFTPMRRITTSYAATIRYMLDRDMQDDNAVLMPDAIAERLLNRSFMVDRQDRLYRDSVLVRFEDGKLNPKATFTALAEFLDIPYTESMTYCSGRDGLNPESLKGNVRGFDTATVYRTYDEFANDDERAFLEYFMRDAYEYYGYDFHYYKGEPVDEAWIMDKIQNFTCLNHYIVNSWVAFLKTIGGFQGDDPKAKERMEREAKREASKNDENRVHIAKLLMGELRFVNKQGQPLHMMTRLCLDPDLLEQPLYH